MLPDGLRGDVCEPAPLRREISCALTAGGESPHVPHHGPAGAFKQKPTVSPWKKTVRWSMNLILISLMGFLINFQPKIAF